MSAQDTIRLLQALNAPVQQAGADYVRAATQMPNQAVLNPGQKPMDLLTNPTPAQNRGLLAASLQMMAHDPRNLPGQTLQKAFQQGFGTLDDARKQQREARIAGAKGRYEVAADNRDYLADGLGLTRSSSSPASVQEYQFVQSLSPEERKQFMALKRAGRVVEGPGGSVEVINPDGTRTTLFTAEEATNLDAAAAGAKERAKGKAQTTTSQIDAGYENAWAAYDSYEEASGMVRVAESYLEALDTGELDTGPINALMYNIFGVGREELATMNADQVLATLQNLGIARLTPVTEKELAMVAKLWADIAKQERPNRGLLRRAIREAERIMAKAERHAIEQANRVKEYDEAEYGRLIRSNPFLSRILGERESAPAAGRPASDRGPEWLESARQGVAPPADPQGDALVQYYLNKVGAQNGNP